MAIDANKRIEILKLIESDEASRNFFFKEVKDPEWIPWLNNAGYLNKDHAPAPVRDEKYISYPNWGILSFLYRIVQLSHTELNAANQIPIIIKFFNEVTECHKDNCQTICLLAKILSSLPKADISIEMLESIRGWLRVEDNTFMISHELCCKLLPHLLEGATTADDVAKAERFLDIILTTERVDENKSFRFLSNDFKFKLDEHDIRSGINKCFDLLAGYITEDFIFKLRDKIIDLLLVAAARYPRRYNENDVKIELGCRCIASSKQIYIKNLSLSTETIISSIEFSIDLPRSEILVHYKKFFDLFIGDNTALRKVIEEVVPQMHASLMGERCQTALTDRSWSVDGDPLNFLIKLYCRLLDRQLIRDCSQATKILVEMFDVPLLLFPKMSLYLIGKHRMKFRKYFWSGFEGRNSDVLFEGLFFGEELKSTLEILPPLSTSQIDIIDSRINQGSVLWEKGKTEENEKVYWRQQRYAALSVEPFFSKKYAASGLEASLGAARGPIVESKSGRGNSRVSAANILNKDCKEIAELLSDFKEASSWEGPNIWDLANELESAVRLKPTHFLSQMDAFLDSGYLWVSRIIRGLGETPTDPKLNVWDRLVPFVIKYTDREEFWNNQLAINKIDNAFKPNYEWVLGDFCYLVERACREDAQTVNEDNISILSQILHSWIEKIEWPVKQLYDEPVMQAINATAGKTVETFLDLALCRARKAYRDKENDEKKWELIDHNLFNWLFSQDIAEVLTLVGMYLPNLLYLDRSLILEKLPTLLEKTNWFCFMTGFLHRNRYYDELYSCLRDHYIKAFKGWGGALDSRSHEVLVNHATLAYLRGKDQLEGDGVFAQIFSISKFDDLSVIVGVVGRNYIDFRKKRESFNIPLSVMGQVKELWPRVLHLIETQVKYTDEQKRVISGKLTKFTGFIEKLDCSNEELLKRTLEIGVPSSSEYPQFIQYLLEAHKRSSTPESALIAGKMYLLLMDSCTPTYEKNVIVELVEALYECTDSSKLASQICERYGRNGIDFLKPTWDKYELNKS
jgi:hypothetical protein